MRTASALTTLISLLLAPSLSAQSATGAGRWLVGLGVDGIHFAESLIDTAAPSGSAAGLRPDGRVGLRATVGKSYRGWQVELEAGWAGGRVEAGNASVAVKDMTSRVTRWRLAASIDRRVARLGSGELALAVAPSLDWWNVGGSQRARAGAEARLGVRVPLGRLELENRVAVGASGSPFLPADAGPGFRSRAQLVVTAGMGLRLPL